MPVLSPDVSYYLYLVRKGSEETDRELKQQDGDGYEKRQKKSELKSEFKRLQTFLHLFHLVQFVKCWHFCLELNIEVQEKKSKVSAFSTKRGIRHSHGVVVQ